MGVFSISLSRLCRSLLPSLRNEGSDESEIERRMQRYGEKTNPHPARDAAASGQSAELRSRAGGGRSGGRRRRAEHRRRRQRRGSTGGGSRSPRLLCRDDTTRRRDAAGDAGCHHGRGRGDEERGEGRDERENEKVSRLSPSFKVRGERERRGRRHAPFLTFFFSDPHKHFFFFFLLTAPPPPAPGVPR